jgi:hypothetical protein
MIPNRRDVPIDQPARQRFHIEGQLSAVISQSSR